MKKLFSILLLLVSGVFAYSKNIYMSATGSDAANGLTPGTAWLSIAKLNASWTSINPGDSILFKNGDTFYGSIILQKSGTSSSPIIISCYGLGTKPVISGFTILSGWTNNGNGIWQIAAPNVKSTVNLLTINGVPQQIGRYPNANTADGGYLRYESYNGRVSITDNEMTSTTNWAGAEICMKKEGYILERNVITAQSGGTFTYTSVASINPRNNGTTSVPEVPSQANFGYFMQKDARTLDLIGEWYFNNSTKVMQVYFGSNVPSSYAIKVASVDTLINFADKQYIKIINLAFEGSNLAALYTQDASNITVQACDVFNSGAKGIFFWNTPNTLIENCTTRNCLCGGIDVTGRYAANVTVRGCSVTKTATIAGMGSFYDDADMKAIFISVSNTALIEKNVVDTVGYIGIQFQGNGITVQNNYVNYFDFAKDDGGGIYTYATLATGRIVRDNIVTNGIGSSDGNAFPIHAEGIYIDGGARGVSIYRNTCAFNSNHGIWLNDPKDVSVRSNTCIDNGKTLFGGGNGNGSIGWQKHDGDSIYNFEIKGNYFYAANAQQGLLNYYNANTVSSTKPTSNNYWQALQKVVNCDSNYYVKANTKGFFFPFGGNFSDSTKFDFADWKTKSNQDQHSILVPAISSDSLLFIFNKTDASVNYPLDYISVDRFNGTVYNQGYIPLGSKGSAALQKISLLTITPPLPTVGQWLKGWRFITN